MPIQLKDVKNVIIADGSKRGRITFSKFLLNVMEIGKAYTKDELVILMKEKLGMEFTKFRINMWLHDFYREGKVERIYGRREILFLKLSEEIVNELLRKKISED